MFVVRNVHIRLLNVVCNYDFQNVRTMGSGWVGSLGHRVKDIWIRSSQKFRRGFISKMHFLRMNTFAQ